MSRHGKLADDKARITFVAPKQLKADLEKLAKADRRTLSNYLVRVLEKDEEVQKQVVTDLGEPKPSPAPRRSSRSA